MGKGEIKAILNNNSASMHQTLLLRLLATLFLLLLLLLLLLRLLLLLLPLSSSSFPTPRGRWTRKLGPWQAARLRIITQTHRTVCMAVGRPKTAWLRLISCTKTSARPTMPICRPHTARTSPLIRVFRGWRRRLCLGVTLIT